MSNDELNLKKLAVPDEKRNSTMSDKLKLPITYYKHKKQRELINKLLLKNNFDFSNKLILLIKKKLSSYKQQDKNKKILRKESKVITFEETVEKLVASKLKCFYCKNKVYLFYKQIRDKKQWSLDRIDNSVGHNSDNVIISCLECNLKRRTTEMDRFTFTKQLKIKKSNETYSGEEDQADNSPCEEKSKDTSDIKVIKSVFL